MKKIFNLAVKRNADGAKHLDLHIHGVIDGGWQTEDQDSAHVADLIAKLSEHRDASTVNAYINSVGGSAFAGVALYNALEQHPGMVTCYVTGLAASAASLIAMAGKTVMCTGSMMMIHSPSSMAMGNAAEMRKTADVLDKIQGALAEIYVKKTGKSADEINSLLNEETWMTAAEACAQGFANEAGDAPADDGDEEGPEEEKQVKSPEDRGATILWNRVEFPKAFLPVQIIAMARSRVIATVGVDVQRDRVVVSPPILAVAPKPAPEPPPVSAIINRAYLAEKAPELLAALVEEGRVAGVAAERARLQAIDELAIAGCADLIAAAKYGAEPSTAEALCVAVVKAGKAAGADMLAQRRKESEVLNRVVVGTPRASNSTDEELKRTVDLAVAYARSKNGRK